MKTARERFWSHVDMSGDCWLWTASTQGKYGQFRIAPGVKTSAHRYAWVLMHGEIPDGLIVCHTCDNPRCVNVDHMFLGTHADNTKDMCLKDRANKKISNAIAESIRVEYREGTRTQKFLAEKYGVDRSLISLIVTGRQRKVSQDITNRL